MSIPIGSRAALSFPVTERDTAVALGSGDVAVLATPRLIAWLEAATVAATAAELPAGATTVGTRVDVEHLRASAVGARVEVTATVTASTERSLAYAVRATCDGEIVASGQITRIVVDRERFLARLAS